MKRVNNYGVLLRSLFFMALLVVIVPASAVSTTASRADRPNIVLFFVDDLGYGDLSCYGHPTIRSPNIDKLAADGLRFTQWYSAATICSPSRASLMTGRYAVRSGMAGGSWQGQVITANQNGGLPLNETTIANMLKNNGYKTHHIGKWHLGHMPQYLPTSRGFDTYFGVPYSNDMGASSEYAIGKVFCPALPLFENDTIIEQPVILDTLNHRYTTRALEIIDKNKNDPFFLYFAFTHVHTPLSCDEEYCGRSERGIYGDAIMEIDDSVGAIRERLEQLGLAENTLIYFTSDNGPWLIKRRHGGSSGLLRNGKGTTWDGGIRVPAIITWPGMITPGTTSELANTMDILATTMSILEIPLPNDRIIDGKDLSPVLFNQGPSPWDHMFYYKGTPNWNNETAEPGLWAVRYQQYKVHYVTNDYIGIPTFHDPPLIFDMLEDPGENYPLLASEYPDILDHVQSLVDAHKAELEPIPSMNGEFSKDYCPCCDWNSRDRYPFYPSCTCNPENWERTTKF